MRRTINILIVLLFLPVVLFAQKAALSTGNWLKIAIPADGVYKIDRAFLEKHNFLPEDANPTHFRLFGYGGGMLPQANATTRPQGLPELSLYLQGSNDSKFDGTDELWFYAQGPDQLNYKPGSGHFSYQKNVYSDTAYYFLTYTPQTSSAQIKSLTLGSGSLPKVTDYRSCAIIEADERNLIESGRNWVGNALGYSKTGSYALPFLNLSEGSDIAIQANIVSAVHTPASLVFSLNNSPLGELFLQQITPSSTYADKGFAISDSFSISASSLKAATSITLNLELKQNGTGGDVYLDNIVAEATSTLTYQGEPLRVWSVEENTAVSFQINQAPASGFHVWAINAAQQPFIVPTRQENGHTLALYQGDPYPELIAFEASDIQLPANAWKIPPQDLRSQTSAELLIITHPRFLAQATRLANHRAEESKLKVEVVTTHQVYNEFASGRQDVTALRDYIRHIYTTGGKKLKYVLLFGRGSYDYRNKAKKGWNLVPVYESRNSTHPIYSYASDDYFGFLDETEGEWKETEAGSHDLEIGLGRLPVISVQEAEAMVDKIIGYDTAPAGLGAWRNKITFVADDGDSNVHQKDAERLSEQVMSLAPSLYANKIYFDAYEQQQIPSGEAAPKVNEAILHAFQQGSLLMNYTGHGNRNFWSGERVLTKNDIAKLRNHTRLPVMVTATCEFGQHDGLVRAAAEDLVIHPAGGAIALLTTSRPVFSNTNYTVNKAFYQAAFSGEASLRLGDIIRATKNNSLTNSGVVNRNFVLLGDPSQRLAKPLRKVQLSSLQDLDSGISLDTLKAFQRLRISGKVLLPDSSRDAIFNGQLLIELFDKADTFQTRGQDVTAGRMTFQEEANVLFRGYCTVYAGEWAAEIIIPKAIRYDYGLANMRFYAADEQRAVDAIGSAKYIVGGSLNTTSDTTAPLLYAYLNDSSFSNGDRVETNAQLHIDLQDDQGIDISTFGVGQQLIALLDDSLQLQLNDYYQALEGSYKKGHISYPLQNLRPGRHQLKIKASDTHQNTAETTIAFIVGSGNIRIADFYAYPNPSKSWPKIRLLHNRPEDNLAADFAVYSQTGQLIFQQEQQWYAQGSTEQEFLLDCTTLSIEKNRKGLYFLKVILRSETDGSVAQATSRMIVID